MSIGGSTKDCFVLENSNWNYHSSMKYNRHGAAVIQMPNGIYVFGGKEDPTSCEFLPNGSKTWLICYPNFMMDAPQPPRMIETQTTGFHFADGHKINDEVLIVIKYNLLLIINCFTQKHGHFKLQVGRDQASSIVVNDMLIISGGFCRKTKRTLNITEIVDFTTFQTRIVGNLNVARAGFGMTLIIIGSKLEVVAFGGHSEKLGPLDSVEVWDENTETWKMSKMKLNHKRENFGYLSFSSKFSTALEEVKE